MKLIQTITPPRAMQISGVRLRVHSPGADLLVYLVDPSTETAALAATRITPAQVGANGWVLASWFPVAVQPGQALAIEVYASDTSTALGAAKVGERDPEQSKWATQPPAELGALYTVDDTGKRTEQAGTTLCMEVMEPSYTAAEQVVPLTTAHVTGATDLAINAGVQQPEAAAFATFRITLDDARVYELTNGQRVQLDDWYTGDVQVSAVLKKGATMAPVIEPGTTLLFGKLSPSADYIGTRFDMKNGAKRVHAILAALVPSGASVQVQLQDAALGEAGAWQNMPFAGSSANTVGFIEYHHELTGITASAVRLRVLLNGLPAARPLVRDLRAVALQ